MRISAFFLMISAICIGILLGQVPSIALINNKLLLVVAIIFLLIGSIITEVQKEEEDILRKRVP